MPKTEIDALVAEYNQVEEDQKKRLERLYDLMNAREGYRHVTFTGNSWTNCWGYERADLVKKNLAGANFIEGIDYGTE